MNQEYLFIENSQKKSIEKYVNTYKSKGVISEIKKIEIRNNLSYWILKLSKNGNNLKTAKILSELHDKIIKTHKPEKTLTSECSAYFNKQLYPLINDFERKLRKYIYLSLTLGKIKEKKNKDNKEDKTFNTLKNLEEKTFGEIFDALFTDLNFMNECKKAIINNKCQFSKKDIIRIINELQENTLWTTLFTKNKALLFSDNYVKIKDYRNSIMHAHNINYKDYLNIKRIYKEINLLLDEEIKNFPYKHTNQNSEQRDKMASFSQPFCDALTPSIFPNQTLPFSASNTLPLCIPSTVGTNNKNDEYLLTTGTKIPIDIYATSFLQKILSTEKPLTGYLSIVPNNESNTNESLKKFPIPLTTKSEENNGDMLLR